MAEISFPFDALIENGVADREYTSADFAKYFASFVGNGILGGGSALQVSGNGFGVVVGTGKAFIKGYYYENETDKALNLITADSNNPRIDRVVLRLDLNTLIRSVQIYLKPGSPASSPTAPSLTRTNAIYELSLATILVNANVSTISNADIKDTRLNGNECGIVSGLIEQADLTNIFNQYENYLNQKIAEWNATKLTQQTEFDAQIADFEAWLQASSNNIANLQKFDFDNLIYMPGYFYSVVSDETSWEEGIYQGHPMYENIYAQRITTKTEDGFSVQTICEDKNIDTTIIYTKVNGNWMGAIS